MAQRLNGVMQRLRASVERDEDTGADSDLLARFVAGRDGEAFAALVRRHGPMVLGVCSRVLRDRHDAEDAFQATFLVLAKKAASLPTRRILAGWLHEVAHRSALAAHRAAAVRRKKERQAAEMARREPTTDDLAPEVLASLDRELAALPERYRAPVILCDLQGRTRREAAKHLGWAEGTLSGRLFRARALLARRLSKHGLSVSGGLLAASLSGAAAACPTSLITTTTQAALGVAAGHVAAVSAAVLSLTQGVLKTMLITKLKVMTAGALVACLVVGAGTSSYKLLADESVPNVAQATPAPAKVEKNISVSPQGDDLGANLFEVDLLRERLEHQHVAKEQQAKAAELLAQAVIREKQTKDLAEENALLRKQIEELTARLEALAPRQPRGGGSGFGSLVGFGGGKQAADAARRDQLQRDRDRLLKDAADLMAKATQIDADIAQLGATGRPPTSAETKLPRAKPNPQGGIALDSGSPRAAVLRIYQVDELVSERGSVGADGRRSDSSSDLLSVITQMVAPESWSAKGGPGTIAYFPKTKSLFVSQPEQVQKRVAELLDQLRELAKQHQKVLENRGSGTFSPPKQ
jgi:RNA polymerase sigma factor (sigma-70 family)